MTTPVVVITDDADATSGMITIMGPGMVSFHCTASTLGGGKWVESLPVWTFGDPTGRYNELRGFSAAHFWDVEPESNTDFVVRSTLTNINGESSYVERTVRITPNTRRVVYIDPDTGVASPADPTNPSTPYNTIANAVAGESNGSNREYRFTAGKTHVWGASVAGGASNVICRSTVKGQKFYVLMDTAPCVSYGNQVLLRDAAFLDSGIGYQVRMLDPRSGGTTIRQCVMDCTSVDPRISIVYGALWNPGVAGSKSVLILGVTATEQYSTVFFAGPMMTHLDVHATHTGGERAWRGAGDHILIHQCSGTYTGANKTALTRDGGDFCWISECEFHAENSTGGLGTAAIGHSSDGYTASPTHTVFERNICYGAATTPAMLCSPKAQALIDCAVRNNIFIDGGMVIGSAAQAYPVTGLLVAHNTFISSNITAKFIVSQYYDYVTIVNNLGLGYPGGFQSSPEILNIQNTATSNPNVTNNVMPPAYTNLDARVNGGSPRISWSAFNVLGIGSGTLSKVITIDGQYRPIDTEDTDLRKAPPAGMALFNEDYYGNPRSGATWLAGAVGSYVPRYLFLNSGGSTLTLRF